MSSQIHILKSNPQCNTKRKKTFGEAIKSRKFFPHIWNQCYYQREPRAVGLAEVVEHPLSKQEALSSNPPMTEREREKEREIEIEREKQREGERELVGLFW
jgi:hypothetical protein